MASEPIGTVRMVRNGLMACALAALAGCSSNVASQANVRYGAPTSELAVRGFLDAVDSDDYQRMSGLFGTDRGPAVERFGVADVEQRMIFLAKLLKHRSYELEQVNLAQLGPDRVRWEARMRGTRKGDVIVPVVTVPDPSGRWFVERLNVDALAARTMP